MRRLTPALLLTLALGCGSSGWRSAQQAADADLAERLWELGIPRFRITATIHAIDAAGDQSVENIADLIVANTTSSEGYQLPPDDALELAISYESRRGGG